jgi:hypothetical protein
MDRQRDYEWSQSLEKIIKSGFEKIREELKQAELKVAEEIRSNARFRDRKSRPVTYVEKLALQVVSCLYFVERAVRAIVAGSFASEFLFRFQTLTKDSEALVKKQFGPIPIPLPLPESQADGTGGLTVAMLLTSADEESVRTLLAEGLRLSCREELGGLRDYASGGRYPIMIGLGFNSGVGPVLHDRSFVKMKYLELTIGVPGVRLSREPDSHLGPFLYIPLLLLNSVTPTLLGWAFGFKKRLKRIKADELSYRISRLISGRELLKAEVTPDPNRCIQLATNIVDLAPWLDLLDKPIVTRTWWGDLKFTFFHWDWMFTPVSPARVKWLFGSDEVPLVPKGPSVFSSLPEADSGNSGATPVVGKAYLMSVPWRLLLPFERDALERKTGLWRRIFTRK